MALSTHVRPQRSEYLLIKSFPQVTTPEQHRLTLLQTHSNCYIELQNVLKTSPFTSHQANSLLGRVENAKTSLLNFESDIAKNRTLRALNLSSDPVVSQNNFSNEASVLDDLAESFRGVLLKDLQPNQYTPLLNQDKKNSIAKKFSDLALETATSNHLLPYKTNVSDTIFTRAFSYLSTPLNTLIEVSPTLFPEDKTFSLPTKTFHFFLHTLRNSPLQNLHRDFCEGAFSRIRSFTLGSQSFVLKSSPPRDSLPKEQIEDRKRQLKIEACVYMAFTNTNSQNILRLKAYSKKGLCLEIGEGDFFNFLNTRYFLSTPPKLFISTLRCFFYQIAVAISSFHSARISHEDIKPENIIFIRRGKQTILKLCDFGFASRFGVSKKHLEGTFNYIPPSRFRLFDEFINNPEMPTPSYLIEPHVDCWAFGILMYLYISDCHPFYAISSNLPEFVSTLSTLQAQMPKRPINKLREEALELCKNEYIKNLTDHPLRIQDIFEKIPESIKTTIARRDPKGIFRNLILQCLDPNDATRINIENILRALTPSPNLPLEYH